MAALYRAGSERRLLFWSAHPDEQALIAGTVLEGALTGAVAVAVTVEPEGGSQQPTSEPFVVVPLG